MKRFEVNIKKVEEMVKNGNDISLKSTQVGTKFVERRLGKYRTVDDKKIVKPLKNNDIKNIRVGDLYFNSDEIESVKKR